MTTIMAEKSIAVISTMDTKAAEAGYLSMLIRDRNYSPILVDVGPLSGNDVEAEYSNRYVAQQGGWDLDELIKTGKRDLIMSIMGDGAASILINLLKQDKVDGAIGIGGNQGSTMAATAMQGLPIGFPKFLVSTVASGNIRPYIAHTDIGVMFSIADLVGGPNLVTRSVLSNAVSALMGMVAHGKRISMNFNEKSIALTALGNTENAADRINHTLRGKGFQVITFHASGAGGTAMETLIEEGYFNGLIDLTPHELIEEVVGLGAYVPVKSGRMTTAAKLGIPQIVSTGGLEYLCFGPKHSIPPKLKRRKTYFHNPNNANVKASRSEMETAGRVMAERLNTAKGPVKVLVPLKGWSIYGSKGGPLYDPKGNDTLIRSLRKHLNNRIGYEEIDVHINDAAFADTCIDNLINLMDGERK